MEDAKLVTNYLNGDKQALNILFDHHLALVYRVCLRFLQNQTDAEDAVQESFVKIWKNLHRFDLSKNFSAWAGEITKNTCLDILKKKKVIPFSAFETDTGNSFIENLASGKLLPAELADQVLSAAWLKKLLSKLSPAYKKILQLYYFEDLNFREISEVTNEPLHTVKSRHRRALLQIRKILNA